MQFSTIIFALFASVAFASPAAIEARQSTIQCNECRKECFFIPGSEANFKKCLDRCNKDIGCNLTP
nr:uncharacterized protein CTRU02_00767 [Colletotrichum truncatum]KAF6802018.1 hypothetical protein CTRU02_00767 [Colletotrichum truncatum]